MKISAACIQTLPKEKFSKKQWQLKLYRRCKDCIAANREVELGASNDESLLFPNGEEAPRYTDEELFRQPPPRDECPICLLTMPLYTAERNYQACCGKEICMGCMHAVEAGDDRILCPFCRTPAPSSDRELVEMTNKRVEGGDAGAMYALGCYYDRGKYGLPQNYGKANKLWLRAGDFGHAGAYFNLGNSYDDGDGVERDEKKAKYHYGLAALRGDVEARYNLGTFEEHEGNMGRAMKHYMIAAGFGDDDSLNAIRECFWGGFATKDNFDIEPLLGLLYYYGSFSGILFDPMMHMKLTIKECSAWTIPKQVRMNNAFFGNIDIMLKPVVRNLVRQGMTPPQTTMLLAAQADTALPFAVDENDPNAMTALEERYEVHAPTTKDWMIKNCSRSMVLSEYPDGVQKVQVAGHWGCR